VRACKVTALSRIAVGYLETNGRSGNENSSRLRDSVSDPYSFFPVPDPEVEAGDQYGSGSNPDPGL
jgi:hypothetical protein